MDDYKSETNPEVLAWARKTAGYAIDDVVAELGDQTVTAETIKAWESGDDSPMYLTQLKSISKIYQRAEFVFFMPKPPIDDTLDRLGSLPEHIKVKLPPKVRFLHREARVKQLSLQRLLYEEVAQEITLRSIATLDDDVITLANSVRQVLGITVAEQKQWQNSSMALRKWREAIENTGIWVFFTDFEVKEYDGFYLEDEQYPVIFIDNSLLVEQQIFTLFHELGHVLLAKGGMYIHGNFKRLLSGEYDAIEQFCCEFVEEFLVPKADLLATDNLADSARQYKVEFAVIAKRHRDNELLTLQQYHESISAWEKQSARSNCIPADDDFLQTKCKCLGVKFILLTFAQFARGEIDELKLAKYLDITMDKLPILEELAYKLDYDLKQPPSTN